MSTKDGTTVAKQGDIPKISPESLIAIEKFVDKLGGFEKAKLAIETLDKIRKAA